MTSSGAEPGPGAVDDPRTIFGLIDGWAERTPGRPAAAFPSGEQTYAELAEASLVAARRLRAAGVTTGDRVGILLREATLDYLTLALGAMRLGAICVPINARNKTHELAYVMDHAGLRLLATSPEFAALVREAGPPDGCRTVVLGADADFDAGAEAVDPAAVTPLSAAVGPEDIALLLYTSGTTAHPKGCLIAHGAMLAAGRNGAERLGVRPDDRMWTPLAFFHIGGWQVLATVLRPGGCFSHVGFFDPSTAIDQLERERVTIAMPAFELIWMAVLDHPRFAEADLGSLRIVLNVGVRERLVRMQERVPHAIQVSMFGMTESCGSMCMGDPHADSLESRTTTSGRPMPGIEVRIANPEGDADRAMGEPGELVFRGVAAFSGYHRDAANTSATIDADGWIHTGDLARQEPDGTIAYMSRLKDMLKVGGENVSAAEIEGYMISHPSIAVVAVVAAPDARYGEVAAAYVRLAPDAQADEQELIAYCMGSIATYKVPRYVRFVDDYPVTATQKIQKNVLRDWIADELRASGITEAPKLVAPPAGGQRPSSRLST